MPLLTELQTTLARRRQRLGRIQRATAASTAALAGLVAVACLFLGDWLAEPERPFRAWALALTCAALSWIAWRMWIVWIRPTPSLLELAVEIGYRNELQDDLVAALEFDSTPAGLESRGLRLAVVERVADVSRTIQIAPAPWPPRLAACLLAAGTLAGGIILTAILCPSHARAFGDRLLLGSAHYPTRCRIESISANGVTIAGAVVQLAEQEPVEFRVCASGQLPPQGEIRLESKNGRLGATAALRRLGEGQYAGALPQLTEPIICTLFLGDAWSEPFELAPATRPVVELEWRLTPPAYARNGSSAPSTIVPSNSTGFEVLSGSSVTLRLRCLNRPLDKVCLLAVGRRIDLRCTDGQRRHWRLGSANGPLKSIEAPLRYAIAVVDDAGLAPATPLEGEIRLKSDLAPHVSMSVVSRHVLPGAKPVVRYAVADDIALRSLRLRRRTLKTNGQLQTATIRLPLGKSPLKSIRGQFELELAELNLAKGDRLQITLEAEDDRGSSTGQISASEPLLLHVTDERGVLDALTETDVRSTGQLDDIIDTQLRSGGEP